MYIYTYIYLRERLRLTNFFGWGGVPLRADNSDTPYIRWALINQLFKANTKQK